MEGLGKKKSYGISGNHLGDLWSEASSKAFIDRSRCFAAQYNNYSFDDLSDMKLDGQRCLNENMADNFGFQAAYKAYSGEA